MTHSLTSVTTRHMPHILPAFPLGIKRTMQSTRTVTVREIAEVLREPELQMVARVLRTLGEQRTVELVIATLQCEAEGGMRTKAGTRRSTGGVFVQLCRERSTPEERRNIFR